MDIWAKVKQWFEDVVTPADLEWYDLEDKAEKKPQKTSEKSTKSSESR